MMEAISSVKIKSEMIGTANLLSLITVTSSTKLGRSRLLRRDGVHLKNQKVKERL